MRQTLTSPRGMVTAPHHLASSAAISILREGGNAIEAMVAAAATIAIVYPHMNSIGGDGFWLISEPGKEPVAIDACGRAAGLASIEWYRTQGVTGHAIPGRGPLAANTVAGAISGWQEALRHSERMGGKLPISRLLADAIYYAKNGAPVTQSQVNFTSKFLSDLGAQPGFANQYLNDSPHALQVPQVNTMRCYEALGNTLQALSKNGLDSFYRGDIAAANAAQLEKLGSPLRLADFQAHRASSGMPLSVKVTTPKGGAKLYNLPAPTQGLASLMILAIFDKLRIRHAILEAESFEYLHAIVEATKQAFKIRNRYIADPSTMRARGVNAEQFLTDTFIDQCAQAVDMRKTLPWPEKTIHGDTVWLGAADSAGRMVSYIQSVYWEFGAGLVLAGTGVGWQNRGSSFVLDPAAHLALEPYKKPFHTLNPAYARFDDGRRMVYGNMGGDGQPQSQSAVFSRYAMYGQSLQMAVSAPRWLLGRTWGQETTTLKFENRTDTKTLQALRDVGHDIEMLEEFSDSMGHAGAIVRQSDGLQLGAVDPRSDGAVAGF